MNPDKLSQDLLEALTERGYTEETIKTLSPEEAFEEYCNWNGLINWGTRLKNAMTNIEQASN